MVTEFGKFALVRRVEPLWMGLVSYERGCREIPNLPRHEDTAGSWQAAANMKGFTKDRPGALVSRL